MFANAQRDDLNLKNLIEQNKNFHITKCQLYNFRNYRSLAIEPCQGINVIYGENGSGKTNFLEAISIFSTEKGIKSENFDQMFRHQTGNFELQIEVDGPLGITEIQIQAQKNYSSENDKSNKKILIDGNLVKKNSQLNQAIRQVSLHTHAEMLSDQAGSKRRKFFDKLITIFHPEHAKWLLEYEKATAQRNKILQNYQLKYTSWIDGIEKKMTETTSMIAARRIQFTQMFNQYASQCQSDNKLTQNMPKIQIHLDGFAENIMRKSSAVELEEQMKTCLKNQRKQHSLNSRTQKGAHSIDIQIFHCDKKCYANQCSTGEKKLLVITLIFTQLLLMKKISFGFLPILLFDEFKAHLDANIQQLILNEIKNLNLQAFITTTEYHHKQFSIDKMSLFNCKHNQIFITK